MRAAPLTFSLCSNWFEITMKMLCTVMPAQTIFFTFDVKSDEKQSRSPKASFKQLISETLNRSPLRTLMSLFLFIISCYNEYIYRYAFC